MSAPKHIREVFDQYERASFAEWLNKGMRIIYAVDDSKQANAFEPVAQYLGRQESLPEDLASIYEDLVPDTKKLGFRQAVGDVLRTYGASLDMPIQAVRDIVYLLARIRAEESLDALVPAIGTGSLGGQHPELLYDAIAVLHYFSHVQQAYDVTFDLATSPNFDHGYLFEALTVMVESQPSRCPEAVRSMLPRLTTLRAKAREFGDEEWSLFCEALTDWTNVLAEKVPLQRLVELFATAPHESENIWFFEALFCSPSSSVRIEVSHDLEGNIAAMMIDDNNSSNKLPIEYSGKYYWTLKAINNWRDEVKCFTEQVLGGDAASQNSFGTSNIGCKQRRFGSSVATKINPKFNSGFTKNLTAITPPSKSIYRAAHAGS